MLSFRTSKIGRIAIVRSKSAEEALKAYNPPTMMCMFMQDPGPVYAVDNWFQKYDMGWHCTRTMMKKMSPARTTIPPTRQTVIRWVRSMVTRRMKMLTETLQRIEARA